MELRAYPLMQTPLSKRIAALDVWLWHIADIDADDEHVPFWG